MGNVLILLILFWPLLGFAAQSADDSCSADLQNIYLAPRFSTIAVADREDRVRSEFLPGREGNTQRFLVKGASRLSPQAKELVNQVRLFMRAGSFLVPPTTRPLTDWDLSNLLIETEEAVQRPHFTRAISDLILSVGKSDLTKVFDLLRTAIGETHPIFGDVRTDILYPAQLHDNHEEVKNIYLKLMGINTIDDKPVTLEELRHALNPPPGDLETDKDKISLAELRQDYIRLLQELPVFAGVSYWGASQSSDVVSSLVPGSIYEIKPFYNDVNVFAGTPYYNKAAANLLQSKSWPHLVMYKINGRFGRITDGVFTSPFPEIVFLPGTNFRVDSHEFLDGIHYVEITEVTKSIATEPKEQELKVILNRHLKNGQHPTDIRDLAGRTWSVWYDQESDFKKSFDTLAWRNIFSSFGISSVEAFRISLDAKTTVYLEEKLSRPHLDAVPEKTPNQWLIPSYLALVSQLLGDSNVQSNKISVYDLGGGRWVANNFWNRGSLLESLSSSEEKPIDAIASDSFWKPFFKKQQSAFFLGYQIGRFFPVGRFNPDFMKQFPSASVADKTLTDEYFRALGVKLNSAEDFIRHKYYYARSFSIQP